MGTFEDRRLTTSTPRSLNTGFPVFFANSTIDQPLDPRPIGSAMEERYEIRVFDTAIPLLAWRLRLRLDLGLFTAAFYGFNLEYTIAGETRNNGTGALRARLDEAAGGVGFGVNLQVTLPLGIQRNAGFTYNFQHGIVTIWEDTFSQTLSFNVDLVNLLIVIANAVSGLQLPLDLVRAGQTVGSNGAMWGLFAEARAQFAANRGTMQLRPTLNFSPNILDFVPETRAVLRKLRLIGAVLTMGPTFNIVFPITIQIVRLTTEDGNYAVNGEEFVGTLRLQGGPRRSLRPTVRDVAVTHSHTIGLEFTLDIRFHFTFLGLATLSQSTPIPLNFGAPQPPLRATNILGPYFTRLSNNGGVAKADLPEVVWG
jgi:hypothetical protein